MNKQQLASKIWESANKMRSKIEANEYKDYILGFIFYKYLSDKMLYFAAEALDEKFESLQDAQKIFEESYNDAEVSEDLLEVVFESFDSLLFSTSRFAVIVVIDDVWEDALESFAVFPD